MYMKEILPKTLCLKHVMSMLDSIGIKHIYSNPYHPKGNSRIENVYNFLKHTITKFTYDSQLEWDDVCPLATYSYNLSPSMDDLESPFYPLHVRDSIEGRLSNLLSYCRYLGDLPRQVAVQELRKLVKLHAKLLEENKVTKTKTNKKITKASDLKGGQLVYVKDHCKGPFNPTYTFDHRIAAIVSESMILLTTPDGKKKEVQQPPYQVNVCSSHQQVPSSSCEIAFRRVKSAYSKVTSIICMQETTSCSKVPNAQVANFNIFLLISISTYVLQSWCRKI